MGKTKELAMEIQQSKFSNRHDLDEQHWNAVLEMVNQIEEAEQIYYHQKISTDGIK